MAEPLRLPRAAARQVVRLVVNTHVPKTPDRIEELRNCLWWNAQVFDAVHHIGVRFTYERLMQYCPAGSAGGITVIANADIEFPEATVDALGRVDLGDHCLALTRYNWTHGSRGGSLELQEHARGSQDCWIFQGPPKPVEANFTQGRRGCDNRFAYELQRAGYKVVNPCLTLKTIHHHASEERDYLDKPIIPRPYLLVEPCELEIVG